jgi:glycosyltransferase involved in cell wall biosynthesis
MKRFRLAYFVSHPIQYQAPLLRLLAEHDQVDLHVYFVRGGDSGSTYDRGFGQSVAWDVPLADGYDHTFLSGIRLRNGTGFLDPLTWGVRRVVAQGDWDAVWFHGYAHYALLVGMLEARRRSIPILFRAESNLISTSKGPVKDRLIRALVRRCAGLLWVSSHNRDYYKHYGAREEQLFFTPYAVDNEFFRSRSLLGPERKRAMREAMQLVEGLPIVLFAGKLIRRKNPIRLLEALAATVDDHGLPMANLIYVGDGPLRPQLEERLDALDLRRYVKILGFKNQTELPDYLGLCDLFVIPSENEPFGLILNEAMSAGKAVIATDEVGGARDLVGDGSNGFVIPAGDTEALRKALFKALKDESRLIDMGASSLKRISRWSYREDVDGILQCLESTVGK